MPRAPYASSAFTAAAGRWKIPSNSSKPPSASQKEQVSSTFKHLHNAIRQLIVTVNGQLSGQFAIEKNYAHTFWGLCTRLFSKLTGTWELVTDLCLILWHYRHNLMIYMCQHYLLRTTRHHFSNNLRVQSAKCYLDLKTNFSKFATGI